NSVEITKQDESEKVLLEFKRGKASRRKVCFLKKSVKQSDGNTALHEASWHGFSQCVKLLVKAGADMDITRISEPFLFCSDCSLSFQAGNTALHLACQNAHAQTARLLLLGGSSPDTKNNMGDTCLHVAARYNNQTLVKILLKSQCSLMETNQGGDTALHVAATLNHKKTVQLLLEAGADGKIKNKAGKSALDKARDNNHREVALLLARSSQVHRFLRGRTIIKRKKRLCVEVSPTISSRYLSTSLTSSGSFPANEVTFHVPRASLCVRGAYSLSENPNIVVFVINCLVCQVSNDSPKGQNDSHVLKDLLCDDGGDRSTVTGKTYQLYTLYRDREGKVKQAPASGCHCKSVLKKLEEQVKATQGEMRLHILNVQEEVNSRLGKIDRRNRHQIKVLDMLNQERVAEERRNMLYRMEQKAAQVGQEALLKQVSVHSDLTGDCKRVYFRLDSRLSPLWDSIRTRKLPPGEEQPACYGGVFETQHTKPDLPSDESAKLEYNVCLSTLPCQVTQCFFETVSTQLERWCQRKILEVEQQAELRAQQDREELLQRIGSLEEELQRLKTSENMDSLQSD
uniref:Ankyrin repeat domain 6a n=1 Tax=Salarias fasciatus TaxID=181472 RepID=A0A672J828_SALFA